MKKTIENFFNIREMNTSIGTELTAGITTFLTMGYIIVVNPGILKICGMPFNGVLAATVLVCSVSSILMGILANLPYGLAPGMGINAFFTFSMVLSMKINWQTALGAVFISGVIFIILTLIKVRKLIVVAIPSCLRRAVAAGIGLFIAFIGFKNAGFIVKSDATFVKMGDFGPETIIFIIGLFLTSVLILKKIRGSLLIGIVATTVLGVIFGKVHLPQEIVSKPDFHSVLFKLNIISALKISMISPIFTLLFVDMFDSISTFLGVAQVSNLLDESGQPKNINKALFVDAVSTTISGLFGTSAGTTYIESAAGVEAGGRTGLTAVVIGLLFLPFLFISNLAGSVPDFATAPALILVGVFMMGEIGKINFKKFDEGIPAFLGMVIIPLSYSITDGIIWGFISYTALKLILKKFDEIHPMMYIITIFSIIALIIK